ncbi:MAG: peptidyl-prolyl cis-trans isomerase [Campylobacterota bacterium]|nr:peptidyl-prolyl cis-trans isomerase [Campylobacterota bacterium]
MFKYLFSVLLTSAVLNAGLINGIAIVVNDEAITHYDIDKKVQDEGLSKNRAVSSLIDDILYDQEIKKNNITADIFEVENQIERIAASNGMDIIQFKEVVKQQQDYEAFKRKIKKQLLHQKLVKKVSAGKLKYATDEDIKIFYENNIEQFKIADTIDVIAYVAKRKDLLQQLKTNPMTNNNEIMIQNITFKQQEMNPQVRYVVNNTAVKAYSSIFSQNGNFNMFFVKSKNGIKEITLNDVKESVFSQIMRLREESFLKEYFETLKITADIEVLK